MQLKLITNEFCPDCSAPVVAESCRHTHCNGQGFEERTFGCGCVLAWCPNFGLLEVKTKCPKNPDELASINKQKKLIQDIIDLILKSNVDDQFKEKIDMCLPRNYPHY